MPDSSAKSYCEKPAAFLKRASLLPKLSCPSIGGIFFRATVLFSPRVEFPALYGWFSDMVFPFSKNA
jgi:hypothetical protein